MRVWHGRAHPLGTTWDGRGVNVAVFSEQATRIELCLFDSAEATRESERLPLPVQTGRVWHGYFPDLRPGQLYGLRADGPYDPPRGLRCNVNKLLFDPHAKAVGRDLVYSDALYGYSYGSAQKDLSFDTRDSAAYAPLAAVIDGAFAWGADTSPRRALADTVIYELHVKGFTMRHPGVPEGLRGTYAGLASPAAVEHLIGLGVNAVELLPVHYRASERFLVEEGLTNYWGIQHPRLLRPGPAAGRCARPGRRRAGIQVDGGDPARRGGRGVPRCRLQPHRRNQRTGPDVVIPRPGQPRLLPPRRRPPVHLRRHRNRQLVQRRPPADPPARHRQPALLGHRDACRRFPLRSGTPNWPGNIAITTGCHLSWTC